MNRGNDERIRDEKLFIGAIDKPHILIFAEKFKLKSTEKTIEGLISNSSELAKLQYALAKYSDEKELQESVDFFTGALERHRKIDKGEKAEVLPLKDDPNKS